MVLEGVNVGQRDKVRLSNEATVPTDNVINARYCNTCTIM